MHEVSICQSLRRLIESRLQDSAYSQVRSVLLAIGELAAIDERALQFCFPAVMKGSAAENARILIKKIPGEAQCGNCGTIRSVHRRFERCLQCGQYLTCLTKGEECDLIEIEVI